MIDIQKAIAFWELKDEIEKELRMWLDNIHHDTHYQRVAALINKIEALDKNGE